MHCIMSYTRTLDAVVSVPYIYIYSQEFYHALLVQCIHVAASDFSMVDDLNTAVCACDKAVVSIE